MKQNYCTLFDSNYLTRALVMYDSMTNSHMDFHLYIFAFDNLVLDFFTNKFIKSNITVVPLSEFEDDKLLAVKLFRSPGEYCWTSTPSVILYSIKKFNLDSCTYIDADLYFYTDPNILIQEMNDKSILLTEHRFTKEYEDKVNNPKTHNSFFFTPTLKFKMVMYWSHFKYSFSKNVFTCNLDNNTKCFDIEYKT